MKRFLELLITYFIAIGIVLFIANGVNTACDEVHFCAFLGFPISFWIVGALGYLTYVFGEALIQTWKSWRSR